MSGIGIPRLTLTSAPVWILQRPRLSHARLAAASQRAPGAMSDLAAPPVLSTPDDHMLELPAANATPTSTLSDDALRTTYDVARTAAEIRAGGWRAVALQFPDHMLVDAPRVVESLRRELAGHAASRIHVLADTSYSACCVDEVAAEHADADVVVHYGRACLSPTSRLPVIYVYTSHELDHRAVVGEFASEFGDKEAKVVVMADLTYQDHVDGLVEELNALGYANVVATEVVRDPAGVIPNRRISGPEREQELLKTYSLFHISDPPPSLLLALQSRFASLHVLSTSSPAAPSLDNPTLRTAGLLRRRFARVLSLASAGVVGILVNTLSVSNYLSSIDVLRDRIARAGKKSYTVVVGKLNPAKLANFAEVEGWVVVGCWESGLVDEDAGYWRPVVTPFEMELGMRDAPSGEADGDKEQDGDGDGDGPGDAHVGGEDGAEGEESLPPRFDLRTGKLVGHSRPMQRAVRSARRDGAADGGEGGNTTSLARRGVGELASVNGVASPGAEYLRSKRTWQGLGSDFDAEASTVVEEGRSGLARGYRVGDGHGHGDDARH
ncbi:Diphthamide biosynthesis protein 2 [Tolypocladium paradoxum]|uniref:2-(3-amino-3-carboxypropyl)histidine synthase subunit 2 n=1 Tax=Tolypocladium paradoxum TaxID=94208 RepID=A0A2S4L763_9HYPO|nr:Diphthamide biosynthesis protein 2 [Tolypocladium paradoxum]